MQRLEDCAVGAEEPRLITSVDENAEEDSTTSEGSSVDEAGSTSAEHSQCTLTNARTDDNHEPSATRDHARCFKTELCSHFSTGNCRFGDACSFAHGVAELRARPRSSRWKTSLCWFPPGACKYGARCRYLHRGESKVCVGDQQFLISSPPFAAHESDIPPIFWHASIGSFGLPMGHHAFAHAFSGALPLNNGFRLGNVDFY
jgi:hypothetical protein